jgi:predicted Zn-dependent peptidase
MKKHIAYFFLAFALFSSQALLAQEDFRKTAPAPFPAPKIQLGNSVQTVLPNGLKVIVVENHKLPRVSFQLFIDQPIRLEGELAGLSDIAGQLLKSGTKTRNKAQIDEAIDFIGANLSTSSSGIFAGSLTKHKDKLLEIMTDVLFNPAFPAAEFDKVKKQTLSGLASGKDDPNTISNNVSQTLRYGKNHPYGELTTEKTVDKITVDQCKKFYQTYFKPNISYLIIVGDIKPVDAQALALKYFGKWVKGVIPTATFPQPKAPQQTEVDFVNKDGAVQSVVTVTYPLDLKPGSPDEIKADLMNSILGSGNIGRLYKNLREDKGFTYGAYSSLSSDKEVGSFTADASVRNVVTDSSVTEFLKELNLLRDKKVGAEELSSTKAEMAGSFARSLESPQTIAGFALNIARYKLPKDYYQTYLQKIAAVTEADVQAMAQKYLQPNQARIIVVGNQDEVAAKLAKFGKVNYFDNYGNPLTAPAPVSSDVNGYQIIENYLTALGGREKLGAVKDVILTLGASVQGQNIEMKMTQKAPNMLNQTVSMSGMTLMESRYDGVKASVSQMGQKQKLEGKDAAPVADQATMFPELNYAKNGYKVTPKGVEDVNGQPAYKLLIESPGGSKSTDFFDKKSGLKVKSLQTIEQGGQSITSVNEYSDFKAVGGVLFPYKITTVGAMPFPLELIVKSIEVNKGVDEALFKVE